MVGGKTHNVKYIHEACSGFSPHIQTLQVLSVQQLLNRKEHVELGDIQINAAEDE